MCRHILLKATDTQAITSTEKYFNIVPTESNLSPGTDNLEVLRYLV